MLVVERMRIFYGSGRHYSRPFNLAGRSSGSALSLDNVAAKAGYSKWHLQRMFKDVTGHAIGAYIRARRLSKSAVALRLTARPILDIALQYRFDSQQTFTRAFRSSLPRLLHFTAVLLNGAPLVFARRCVWVNSLCQSTNLSPWKIRR